MSSYLRRIYTLPAELEESLAADLLQEGTLGASVEAEPDGRVRLIAWFPPPAGGPAAGERRAAEMAAVAMASSSAKPPAPLPPGTWPPLPAPSRVWPPLPAGVELVAEDVLPDTDWMAEYRRLAVPFPVGRTLLVDPREPDDPGLASAPAAAAWALAVGGTAAGAAAAGVAAAGAVATGAVAVGGVAVGAAASGTLAVGTAAAGAAAVAAAMSGAAAEGPVAAGRRLLRLPARTAFGIGSHPSTSLALELLESAELAGRAVLDAGTGTGILAFAALAWGAARVVGFDSDPVAAFQARANSRLNGLYPLLFAGRAAALAPRRRQQGAAGSFDVVVANVVPEEILPDLADLLPALAGGGVLILSGLPAERADEVAARLAALGLTETARRLDGEWVALQLVRGASGGGREGSIGGAGIGGGGASSEGSTGGAGTGDGANSGGNIAGGAAGEAGGRPGARA